MNNIPQSRLILYMIIGGLLPVFLVGMNFMTKQSSVDQLQQELASVQQQALVREQKQSLNMLVREHYRGADHFYIDKHLETLSFLEPEIESLQKLVNNKYYAGDESVRKRLEFLTSPANDLLFSEGNVQAYPYFQETTATLVHPVEVNLEDLKEVLALIEGQPIGSYKPGPNRPQLIIVDFRLDKKEPTENNEVYQLNVKLLKREYSS